MRNNPEKSFPDDGESNDRDILLKLGPLVRLDLFTDAVFAIIITLLAVEITLPEHVGQGELLGVLWQMRPVFIAHLISFVVLGIEWIDHHTMFESTRKCTRALAGCNLLFCLALTNVPFLTKMLGLFPDYKPAVALYGMGILLITLVKELLRQVISRQSGSTQCGRGKTDNLVALIVGVTAIALAMFHPRSAVIMWSSFGAYSIYIRFNWKK